MSPPQDQASIHTSDRIIDKLPEWEQKKLKIFGLPAYSPKQNLIEILWKFIKYEWIEIEAYADWDSLLKYLKKVLTNFGKEYVINWEPNLKAEQLKEFDKIE